MKFTKEQINKYNSVINDIFIDYSKEKNLAIHIIDDKVHLTSIASYQEPDKKTLDSNIYFKNHNFFDENLIYISLVKISELDEKFVNPDIFWQYADDKLDIDGRILFHRVILNTVTPQTFKKLIKFRSDEQNWFYMKHIDDDDRQFGTEQEFSALLEFSRKIKTDENIKSFYTLIKYSHNILKETRYNYKACDVVYNSVPRERHKEFATLLNKNLIRDLKISCPEDIFNSSSSLTITMDKDKCYEKFTLKDDPVKNTNIYSCFHSDIITGLKTHCMTQLGLCEITLKYFTSENNQEKITFEFEHEKYKTQIPEIFTNLLIVCAPIFNISEENNSEKISDAVRKTVNHYFLNQVFIDANDKQNSIRVKI